MESINVDLIIALVFGFNLLNGFYKGLLWEALKYSAFATGILAGIVLSKTMYPMFIDNEHAMVYALCVGFIGFFLVSSVMLMFVHKISKVLQKTALGSANRLFGGILGVVKAFIFVNLLNTGIMLVTDGQQPAWLQRSMFARHFIAGNRYTNNLLYKLSGPKLRTMFNLMYIDNKLPEQVMKMMDLSRK